MQLYRESGAALPEMVRIEPDCFMMGSEKGDKDELPVHKVCLEQAFYLGKHEVTFEQYDRFAVATGRKLTEDPGWGRGRRPVINVDWQNASDFAAWIGKQSGAQCRLPSEAEWEYAARAGTTTRYALPAPRGSDDIAGKGLANCNGCGSQWDGRQTAPVGSFKPNDWGLFDMHGNVWEWTQDVWHDSYDKAPVDGSAWLDGGDQSIRVLRGGSWGDFRRMRVPPFATGAFPTIGSTLWGFGCCVPAHTLITDRADASPPHWSRLLFFG